MKGRDLVCEGGNVNRHLLHLLHWKLLQEPPIANGLPLLKNLLGCLPLMRSNISNSQKRASKGVGL